MIFFIYAVIGMQVRGLLREMRSPHPAVPGEGVPQAPSPPHCVCVPPDLREGGAAGRDPDQPQQQLPDLPPGRAAALQVGSRPVGALWDLGGALGFLWDRGGGLWTSYGIWGWAFKVPDGSLWDLGCLVGVFIGSLWSSSSGSVGHNAVPIGPL